MARLHFVHLNETDDTTRALVNRDVFADRCVTLPLSLKPEHTTMNGFCQPKPLLTALEVVRGRVAWQLVGPRILDGSG